MAADPKTPRRRRELQLGESATDTIARAAEASELVRDKIHSEIRAGDVNDPLVTVEIEKNFTLTLDNGQPIHYKAGIDEMPKSHSEHWWSINAGGVRPYRGRRSKPADAKPPAPVTPPKPDPALLPESAPAYEAAVQAHTAPAQPDTPPEKK